MAPGGFWYMTRLFGAVLALIVLCSANAASAACTSPAGSEGKYIYNSTHKVFQYCNDTNWVEMNIKPGSGSGGCTNPVLGEGKIIYNEDHRVLQGCAGNTHVPMGTVGGGSGWTNLSSYQNSACGIMTNGQLRCWGGNFVAQLGDGTIIDRGTPTAVSGGGTWKQASVSVAGCGIKSDDTLWCWGQNQFGRTGLNTTTGTALAPTQVSGGGTWKSVSLGFVSCGIKSDDTLWCWGPNANGMTGLNTTTGNTIVPTQVSGGGTWKFVAVGYVSACGIKTDDSLHCWGSNASAVTARGTTTGSTLVPTAVSGGGAWKSVDVGQFHGCGIKTDNSMWCWGNNAGGRTGLNTQTGTATTPTAISGGGSWKMVDTAPVHSCAIKSDDTMHCWGINTAGQLGDTTLVDRWVPTAVTGGSTWSRTMVSGGTTCGILLSNKTMKCWGSNYQGLRADNNTADRVTKPTKVFAGETWKSLKLGSLGWGLDFTCGLKVDGSVSCWGYNDEGALGPTVPLNKITIPKVVVSNGNVFSDIQPGAAHICGMKADGSVMCWGYNAENELGNGNTTSTNTPGNLSGGHTFTKISSRGFHGCGIKADKSMWCWGANWSGQIGDGTWNDASTPVLVSGGHQWSDLEAGTDLTCGIRTDGVLMCWGDGWTTGDGSWNDSNIPVIVNGGFKWSKITAGTRKACGITTTGLAMCWGEGWDGALGDGSGNSFPEPVAVAGGYTYKMISTGEYQTCAIRTDDTLWCWGDSWEGQLGIGTSGSGAYSMVPVQVYGGGTWKTVQTSYYHTCALSKNDEAYCWGMTYYGGIGDGVVGFGVSPMKTLCGSPSGKAGQLMYNQDQNALQYCDGVSWVALNASYTIPDPCAGSPAVGTTCLDGSKYAGMSGADKMFVTLADNSTGTPWNNGNFSNTVATGTTSTSNGKTNSQTIAGIDADSLTGGAQPHQATMICENLSVHGHTDWYLPSIDELTTLYTNRVAIGGFTNTWFWSSTEMDADTARIFRFNTGAPLTGTKGNIYYVRCVRK